MTSPIALTCGEPAGVGLELALKAWNQLHDELTFFLIADRWHMAELHSQTPIIEISQPCEAADAMVQGLPLLHHEFPGQNQPGQLNPENAASVLAVIKQAVSLVDSGQASAICTGPIHKKALQDAAGFAFPGHTEFLAHLGQAPRPVMMLAAPGLRVVPVTIHIPLARVADQLNAELLSETLHITNTALKKDFGIPEPRIAVAGLNPHAGEGGAMGDEELSLISPVLEHLRGEGLDLLGPLSADTMFHPEARACYDVAVCMYHDQALIPLKTLDFHNGTNCTLGLPFVRTSPDHGTALDIAGKDIANPASLIAALRQAAAMAANT